jgi:hypothetical protein
MLPECVDPVADAPLAEPEAEPVDPAALVVEAVDPMAELYELSAALKRLA